MTCVYVCVCVSKLRGKNRLIASDNKLHLSNVYESYVSIGMGVSNNTYIYILRSYIYEHLHRMHTSVELLLERNGHIINNGGF